MPKKKKQKKEVQPVISDQNNLDPNWMDDEADGQLLIDVYQDEDNIYVRSTIAGVEADDIDISLNNDLLTIRGKRKKEIDFDEHDYFYQECYWGSFSRSVILPVEIIQEKIQANLKNGILVIKLPKSDKKRNIPIKVKSD